MGWADQWNTDNAGGGESTFRGVEYAFASFNNVRPKQAFADRFELGDPRYEQTFYDDGVEWFYGHVYQGPVRRAYRLAEVP